MSDELTRERLVDVLTCAGELARAAHVTHIDSKAALDFVTNVDHEIDAWLSKHLLSVVPSIPVLSEERLLNGDENASRRWLIDPLDGTHNYKAGLPFCAISVALFEGDAVVLSAVCDIANRDVYVAQTGRGSWLNGVKLAMPSSHSALIGLTSGASDSLIQVPVLYDRLRAIGKLRNFGAQALHLCYVASGRLALAASFEARLWDDAAGQLIVQEAGGQYKAFGRAQLSLAGIQRSTKSVSGHPDVFDAASSIFEQLWGRGKG